MFPDPEPDSIYHLMRQSPRSRLYSVPLLWTTEHLELLKCKFVDREPPFETSCPCELSLHDDFEIQLQALQAASELRDPIPSWTPVDLLGDLLLACGMKDLKLYGHIPFRFENTLVRMSKYNLYQYQAVLGNKHNRDSGTEFTKRPDTEHTATISLSPEPIDTIMNDLDCPEHSSPWNDDDSHHGQFQYKPFMDGEDYEHAEIGDHSESGVYEETCDSEDDVLSDASVATVSSWHIATIDLGSVDSMRRTLVGLKRRRHGTRQHKNKSRTKKLISPIAAIRNKLYRSLKPDVAHHDPYILALLFALVQQQRDGNQACEPLRTYKAQVLAVPGDMSKREIYLYTAHIPCALLDALHEPMKAFQIPSFDIGVYCIDLEHHETLLQRLLCALHTASE